MRLISGKRYFFHRKYEVNGSYLCRATLLRLDFYFYTVNEYCDKLEDSNKNYYRSILKHHIVKIERLKDIIHKSIFPDDIIYLIDEYI